MSQNPSTACARQLVTALVAGGVQDFVLAAGSRSAPLAYALAAAEEAGWCRVHISVDERTAAFIALGLAHDCPTAVVTTSGTAVANLHPAVLEAHHGSRPLLVITADRPHRLRGVGANQTTDQVRIFGSAVRQSWEIPATADAARMTGSVIPRALAAATGSRTRSPGPVHVNVAFDDPLTPDERWHPGPRPQASATVSRARAGETVELRRGATTVVVAGDSAGAEQASAADRWGWPVLAEPSSGMRGSEFAVTAGHLLLQQQVAEEIERVVVLGRPTLHRSVGTLLARRDLEIIVVAAHGEWVDVSGTATAICDRITVAGDPTPSEQEWFRRWQRASRTAQRALEQSDQLDGPAVAREVLKAAPQVMLGSSMAVRHADLGGPVGREPAAEAVHANRGVAGIDGTIATATGLALRDRAVRVLLGDLSFQHDGLSLIRGRFEHEVDLQVVVLDDDGGSIFATLEHGQARYQHVFERFFRAPQELDMGALARAVGARYIKVQSLAELRAELTQPLRGRSVLHVQLAESARSERHDGHELVSRALLAERW